jgi:signal transduction histidine kinase
VAESTDVTSIPPPGLTVEVLVAGVMFSASAGLAGLAALSPQNPPSVLLLLGWPVFAVVGGILLDQHPGLRLGRTFVALSLAPVAIVAWSLARSGDVESPDLAAAAAELAAPLGCAVAIAIPWAFRTWAFRTWAFRTWAFRSWAFRTPPRDRPELPMALGCCVVAAAGSVVVVASRVAGWPTSAQAAGWVLAGAGVLGTWALAARSVRRDDRASRRRVAWLLVCLTLGCGAVAATWTLWPGRAGFYATCGSLMVGSILIANLWVATEFRPLDEHLLDVGLVLGVIATSAATTGLVRLGSDIAHRTSNATTVAFTALLTVAMTAPAALWVRRSLLARRYGSGLIPPEDVAAITADLHANTDPRELLDKAARTVAAASGSTAVRIVLGDDNPSAPEQWVVLPLEVGGDRVGSLLVESPHPEGLEARQQQVVSQLLPTVALVARAVGLAVEAEHARRDVARERDAERKRVMGDLHDGLGPVLAGMSMRVQAALRTSPGTATPPEYAALLGDLARDLATSRVDLRRIVAGITPSTLADGDLEVALRSLVASFQGATDTPKVGLTVDLQDEVAPAIQVAVYRSVAEGITNGLRHASAATIDVRVHAREGRVLVEVLDDGVGGSVVPGVGLSSLARRAESLGGHLTICPGCPGTALRLDLPASELPGPEGRPA